VAAGSIAQARPRRIGWPARDDLQLTQYDDRGGRATFYTTGIEHSPTSATGTAWERTPWHAVQGAPWIALLHASMTQGGTIQ
jgi:hypothetical protein